MNISNIFLPEHLTVFAKEKDGPHVRLTYLVSCTMLLILSGSFLVSYIYLSSIYDPSSRSFHFSELVGVGIPLWTFLSFLFYYAFHFTNWIYALVPGILLGGGFVLSLISFAFNEAFPGLIFQANLATLITLGVTYSLASFGVLDKFINLEYLLIMFGSLIVQAFSFITSSLFVVQFGRFLPRVLNNFLRVFVFDVRILLTCVATIALMSILSLFHFHEIRSAAKKARNLKDNIQIGATTVFMAFILYLSFLILFARSKARKN